MIHSGSAARGDLWFAEDIAQRAIKRDCSTGKLSA